MNSSIRFGEQIERINELAEQLDPSARTFMFMEWNPLYNETDTAESKFWREWLNIHILLRECRPADIFDSTFFLAIGYTEQEHTKLRKFANLLRNLRLYRCHPNLDTPEHTKRQKRIAGDMSVIPELQPLTMHEWQIRATEADWESALEWLYTETELQLTMLESALTNLSDNAKPRALKAWISGYADWFSTSNAKDLFVKPAIRSYFECTLLNFNHAMDKKEQREYINRNLRRTLENKKLMEDILNAYRLMADYHTFEPGELSYNIITKVLNQQ